MVRKHVVTVGLFGNALLLGFALMGFEMLGSRYLNPYFGGGIETWAALISTVLAALMAGYFIGGYLVDRFPTAELCGILVIAAAVYLGFLPVMVEPLIRLTIRLLGDQAHGVLTAAMGILFLPLGLVGTFSPFGVRLLLDVPERSGRVTGLVYGISTIGNIIGTLATTFILIPNVGIRHMTLLFAGVIAACGVSLIVIERLRSRNDALVVVKSP
jgi:hypothetical protein